MLNILRAESYKIRHSRQTLFTFAIIGAVIIALHSLLAGIAVVDVSSVSDKLAFLPVYEVPLIIIGNAAAFLLVIALDLSMNREYYKDGSFVRYIEAGHSRTSVALSKAILNVALCIIVFLFVVMIHSVCYIVFYGGPAITVALGSYMVSTVKVLPSLIGLAFFSTSLYLIAKSELLNGLIYISFVGLGAKLFTILQYIFIRYESICDLLEVAKTYLPVNFIMECYNSRATVLNPEIMPIDNFMPRFIFQIVFMFAMFGLMIYSYRRKEI